MGALLAARAPDCPDIILRDERHDIALDVGLAVVPLPAPSRHHGE